MRTSLGLLNVLTLPLLGFVVGVVGMLPPLGWQRVALSESPCCQVAFSTIGNRIQCSGIELSSIKFGHSVAINGLSARSDAQMIPTFASMADHVMAQMPEA